jgi:hypothetical protein
MSPVIVLVALMSMAPMAPLATAQPSAAQIQVRTRTFEVSAAAIPQRATVECEPGERPAGGGYSLAASQLRVTSSYPDDGGWTIEVVNTAQRPAALTVSVSCLAGLNVVTASVSSGRVACPPGAIVTGGGFASRGVSAAGSVTNSYPALGNAWVAEGPDVTRATVVCVTGSVGTHRLASSPVTITTVTPSCGANAIAGQQCLWPRSGSQQVICGPGEVLTMGGHRASTGTLPPYGVQTANLDGSMWSFALQGFSANGNPLQIEISVVCLTFGSASATPDPAASNTTLALAGAGLLALLLLIAGLIFSFRRRRPPPAAPPPHIDVVLTGQRTRFRLEDLRELQ